jgi:hypothetical protein
MNQLQIQSLFAINGYILLVFYTPGKCISPLLPQSKQLLTNRRRSGVSAAACNNLGGSTSGFVAVADTAYLSEAVKSCAIT